jgi:2-polyprenyl-3-methyl-5-hydroxy-6-metoxy-1,4-benzoquinol methylase
MDDLGDKAGQDYWDRVWQGLPIPDAVNPRAKHLRNHTNRRFHNYFARTFAERNPSGQRLRLLEVGCARSRWLPYFAKEFGFEVTGLDYSAIGCEQSRAILRQAGVEGKVVEADFTDPPGDLLGQFDVVVSFGVVEHFEDTASCIEGLARFLRPGGLMITSVPNLIGVVGAIQKRVCRAVYDVHVLLDRAALAAAHERSGLTVLSCRYFMRGDFSVMNLSCWSERRLYGLLRLVPLGISLPLWALERFGIAPRPNRLTSPYVICLAKN